MQETRREKLSGVDKGSSDGNARCLSATGTAPAEDAGAVEPAQFRMVLVAFLAAGIGVAAGGGRLSAVQIDWPVH